MPVHLMEKHARCLYPTQDLDSRVSAVSKQTDQDELIDAPQSTQLTPLPIRRTTPPGSHMHEMGKQNIHTKYNNTYLVVF